MNDQMNPLVQFSPLSGALTKVMVPADTSSLIEYENDSEAAAGKERTMFCYAPVSGCPDPKQTQVLFVLRNDASKDSAEAVMKALSLDELSEKEHFILLFPNPDETGWNYSALTEKENDMEFLIRAFACLKDSPLKCNGFNGMLFYIGADPESSAMLALLAAKKPASVSAMMTCKLPDGYEIPEDALLIETAAWCAKGRLSEYLTKANRHKPDDRKSNSECRLRILDELDEPLFDPNVSVEEVKGRSRSLVQRVWDELFSVTRRWQNDTYGTYQRRTCFTDRGFIAHVNDSSLGVNDGFSHTWYEYIPPQLRNTTEKVPLVFYFHGVNCVPLYGAEQSGLHDLADKENFIVVYPAPAICKAWNIFDLPNLPSDFDFVLALIDHMKEVHPIDESRIYSFGFSMGGAMTHAITFAHPEIFAGAAPCNAFSFAGFMDPWENLKPFLKRYSEKEIGHTSYSFAAAGKTKQLNPNLRMPVFQNAGYDDALIAKWPVKEGTDDVRTRTLSYILAYNDLAPCVAFDETTPTGIAADETFYGCKDAEGDNSDEIEPSRFIHQRWISQEFGTSLLELFIAKRMPHAVLPYQMTCAWNFVRKFRRLADGTLEKI